MKIISLSSELFHILSRTEADADCSTANWIEFSVDEIRCEGPGEDLYGHFAIELHVFRAVDFAHPSRFPPFDPVHEAGADAKTPVAVCCGAAQRAHRHPQLRSARAMRRVRQAGARTDHALYRPAHCHSPSVFRPRLAASMGSAGPPTADERARPWPRRPLRACRRRAIGFGVRASAGRLTASDPLREVGTQTRARFAPPCASPPSVAMRPRCARSPMSGASLSARKADECGRQTLIQRPSVFSRSSSRQARRSSRRSIRFARRELQHNAA
jgi:hypothetical protein